MEITETKVQPSPPNIITAIRSGFDVIANRIYLILIPVLLDVWLWLGPHLQIKGLAGSFLETLKATGELSTANNNNVVLVDPEVLQAAVERINLMTLLRTYPIGVPSLVSGILPVEAPLDSVVFIDIVSPGLVLGLWLLLSLFGILAGTFYFLLIAQAVFDQRVLWKKAIMDWPKRLAQVILLTLAAVLIVLVLLIPSTCILSFVTMGGIPVSQIGLLILAGMLVWVLFPLAFTPHGIFTFGINILSAVQRSILVTRLTLPSTGLFFLIILAISQGLDVLWRVPGERSWFQLVGLAGHAFVSSALLAATFIYFRDAFVWVQDIIGKTQLSQA